MELRNIKISHKCSGSGEMSSQSFIVKYRRVKGFKMEYRIYSCEKCKSTIGNPIIIKIKKGKTDYEEVYKSVMEIIMNSRYKDEFMLGRIMDQLTTKPMINIKEIIRYKREEKIIRQEMEILSSTVGIPRPKLIEMFELCDEIKFNVGEGFISMTFNPAMMGIGMKIEEFTYERIMRMMIVSSVHTNTFTMRKKINLFHLYRIKHQILNFMESDIFKCISIINS